MLKIGNPSKNQFPNRLISFRNGGGFSNDKYSEVGVASNTFILQDEISISVIDVENGLGKLIKMVKGNNNSAMFLEKTEKECYIHTNEFNKDDKRKYLRILLN